jgi:hypothetical protein
MCPEVKPHLKGDFEVSPRKLSVTPDSPQPPKGGDTGRFCPSPPEGPKLQVLDANEFQMPEFFLRSLHYYEFVHKSFQNFVFLTEKVLISTVPMSNSMSSC